MNFLIENSPKPGVVSYAVQHRNRIALLITLDPNLRDDQADQAVEEEGQKYFSAANKTSRTRNASFPRASSLQVLLGLLKYYYWLFHSYDFIKRRCWDHILDSPMKSDCSAPRRSTFRHLHPWNWTIFVVFRQWARVRSPCRNPAGDLPNREICCCTGFKESSGCMS